VRRRISASASSPAQTPDRPMASSIELACEGASALISPSGASLRSLTVDARPVVVSVGAFDGAVLVPWPNRIAEGRFVFDGSVHRLPITEPERATALHGLVDDSDWTVLEKSESSVRSEERRRGDELPSRV